MPIHEFVCPDGHKTERIFLSLSEAEKTKHILCPRRVYCEVEGGGYMDDCDKIAKKIISAGGFVISGVSPSAKRIVNPDSVTFEGDQYIQDS